jgi:outer membrane immunogenic protein
VRSTSKRAVATSVAVGALFGLFGACLSTGAEAQILGTAEAFGVLAGSTVTNTGPSVIQGNVGVWPGGAVVGLPPGIVFAPGTIHAGDAVAHMLRSLIPGSAATLIAAGGANAADFYSPPSEVVAPVANYNWTGVYAGTVGGWNHSRARGDWSAQSELLDPPPGFSLGTQMETDFRSTGDGALVGGTVGVNLQRGRFVFGVEGDLAWTDKSGYGRNGFTGFTTIVIPPPDGPIVVTTESPGVLSHRWDMNWFGTARLRAGVTPVDRLLIFGTFGLAAAGVDLRTSGEIDMITITTAKDHTYFGWAAGAGVEYAVTPRIRLKADWLYYDLGSESFRTKGTVRVDLSPGFPGVFEVNQRTKLDLTGNTVRGAVVFAF